MELKMKAGINFRRPNYKKSNGNDGNPEKGDKSAIQNKNSL